MVLNADNSITSNNDQRAVTWRQIANILQSGTISILISFNLPLNRQNNILLKLIPNLCTEFGHYCHIFVTL